MQEERDQRILELERENLELRAEVAILKKRCDQYAQAYEELRRQVNELLRHRFGKKSERFIEPSLPEEENNKEDPAADEDLEEYDWVIYRRKKKSSPKKELPRRVVIIPVSDQEKQCPCGELKTVIRYEMKELLHYQPASFEVIEQRREVVACPKGCDHSIMTAKAPLQVLPKSRVTEEFLSFLVVNKLDDRQPLYHLEKQLEERYGIQCSVNRWLVG